MQKTFSRPHLSLYGNFVLNTENVCLSFYHEKHSQEKTWLDPFTSTFHNSFKQR